MASFKMVVRNGGDVTLDGGEIEASDLNTAHSKAMTTARKVILDLIRRNIPISTYTFDLIEDGFLMKSVTAAEILGLAT